MMTINWMKLFLNIKSLKGQKRIDYIKKFLQSIAQDEEMLIEISVTISDSIDNFKI